MKNVSEKMNSIYRWQVPFYDFLRKYYLLGRDPVLDSLQLGPEIICEIGCGTGRNLIYLAERYPDAQFWGVDAAEAMIKRAEKNILQRDLQQKIRVLNMEASTLSNSGLLAPGNKFDRILFFYTLSMIPKPMDTINIALDNLKANGKLHIVDFSDHGYWPRYLIQFHQWWLKLFGVEYRPEVSNYLHDLSQKKNCSYKIEYSPTRYYEIITFKKGS